ncbi:MAG: pyruvate kinase [Thiogranum sp.]|nr:pyruvate kinase [Thiogranum sp.]
MKNFEIRKTKIVATIGPACDSLDTLKEMIRAGMSVARLNLSHGTLAEQRERLERVRQAGAQLDANIAIMIDTRGIEIRTGTLAVQPVELVSGDRFTLYTDPRQGDQHGVSVSFRKLAENVRYGTVILLDDGAIELRVQSVNEGEIECQVVHGGLLRDRKSVNLPDTRLAIALVDPCYLEGLVEELDFACATGADYIAASFVQNAGDIAQIRELLAERNCEIPIIAKIENREGVANLDAIIAVADGLMVARGDLGVELPLADVPGTQKQMIRKTVTAGKPVITATQMLASMETNPRPTRAEASDVANAILDGTSAVMLSGETAVGKYPIAAVRTMATLALRAESHLREFGYLQTILPNPSNVITEAVSQAAVAMANQLNATAIFSLTATGFTSRLVSKHRPGCPILAITASEPVARRLAMNWGVLPILYQGARSDEAKVEFGIERARQLGYLDAGDIVVATAGQREQAGGTDLIKVMTLV